MIAPQEIIQIFLLITGRERDYFKTNYFLSLLIDSYFSCVWSLSYNWLRSRYAVTILLSSSRNQSF